MKRQLITTTRPSADQVGHHNQAVHSGRWESCDFYCFWDTPHMAWAPVEARQQIPDVTVDNIRAFLNGNPINVVN